MNTIHILLWLILAYYITLHAIYLLLVLLGATQVRRYHRGITFAEFRRIGESPLSMPVSLIIPCYNESAIIVETISNALRLNYPQFEVIVVSDGSTDGSIDILKKSFHLRRVDRFGRRQIETREIQGVYESSDHSNLVVIEKVNGRRADAINAAVTLSRYPLLCIIDADCVLETDALLHMARPFLSDVSIAAVAGIVRPSNGLSIVDGEILHNALPKTLLGMNQEVEYARSFQWARIGLCRLKSMLCISGALLLIKKTLFEEVGGPWPQAITDDIEFTMRLNRHIHDRERKEHARLVFVPDAVCYTEIPEKIGQYASQRNRWQRGTIQALLRNASMIFNPRYGMTGLFGMPFFVVFEALAAIVELSAWILMVVCLVLGIASGFEIIAMIFLAYILGVFLSLTAVLLTESTRLRAVNWRDFWRLILAILLDNLGFHQFHLIIRVIGTFQYLFGRKDLGAVMSRNGINSSLTTQAP
jgi:cellulose synthase/poly-beta-1,6-N-acetylglucosamine synthase-like glycosyltransferase